MKRTMYSTIIKVLLGSVVAVTSAHGGIVYTFSGINLANFGFPDDPVAFQLTAPNFVNPPLNGGFVFFTSAQLDSSTNCPSPPLFCIAFSNQSADGFFSAQLDFNDGHTNSEPAFFFPAGAFGAPGVYQANTVGFPAGNPGTLTVTTPEPKSSQLVLIAIVCLFAGLRLSRVLARRDLG